MTSARLPSSLASSLVSHLPSRIVSRMSVSRRRRKRCHLTTAILSHEKGSASPRRPPRIFASSTQRPPSNTRHSHPSLSRMVLRPTAPRWRPRWLRSLSDRTTTLPPPPTPMLRSSARSVAPSEGSISNQRATALSPQRPRPRRRLRLSRRSRCGRLIRYGRLSSRSRA